MGSLKISTILVVVAVLAVAQAQQPTSFNFDRIRYTFYPGEIARTWPEANAFCKSLGKELAVFANRGQIRNVSEYLSPEGGVWTGYKTNGDCKFESVELAEFEWKKEFGTPLLNKAKPKMCGLLSVSNYTGIVASDCNTKKAALCSLSNPDAIEAETIRDEKAAGGKSAAEAKPAAAAKPAAKSTQVSPPAKASNSTKTTAPPSAPKTPVPVKKPAAKPEKKEAAKKEANEDPEKVKPKPEKAPKVTQKPVEKKPAAEPKPEKDVKVKNDGKEKKDGKEKPDEKDAKSKPAEKAKPKTDAKPKKEGEEESEIEESPTSKPTTKPPTNQLPIQIESEGARFTFFPNHIMFGGYMEYSRFCEDKGLLPAVFTSRSQLEDIASHVNSVVMVWTGYTTDSQGNVHSVDETTGPWQPEFDATGNGASQSLMCGALSTAANKVGITLNSCASAHEALCSAKTYAKKTQKK